jgi:hypothetical protein
MMSSGLPILGRVWALGWTLGAYNLETGNTLPNKHFQNRRRLFKINWTIFLTREPFSPSFVGYQDIASPAKTIPEIV